MNTIYNNKLSFGQLVSTYALLDCATKKPVYSSTKKLCLAIENRFPGNLGYYNKALNYIEQIENKNPQLKEIFLELRKIQDKKLQNTRINEIVKLKGENIDVKI